MVAFMDTLNPPARGNIDWDRVFACASDPNGTVGDRRRFEVACFFMPTDPIRFEVARRKMSLVMAEAMA